MKSQLKPPRELRSDSSIQFSGSESVSEQLLMLTNHINSIKIKHKMLADSLQPDNLKSSVKGLLDDLILAKISSQVDEAVVKMKEEQTFMQHNVTISSDKLDAIKQEVYAGLNLDLSNLVDKTLESYNRRIFSVESSLATLESSMIDLKNSFQPIQSNLARLNDRFEQQALSNQIIVFGVKEETSIENTESQFLSLCAGKFPGIPIIQSDVVSAKRIGKPSAKPRPIVVEFCNLRVRQLLLRQKKDLKGSGILFSETLTKPRLQLLSYAKSKLGLRNVWSSKGDILYKTQSGRVVKFNNQSEIDLCAANAEKLK